MRNRIKYSQNFLVDKNLVTNLINNADITEIDTVYEIGAGDGIITEQLLKKAGKVISFELDKVFFDKLTKKFQNESRLELNNEDFLSVTLPPHSYKVFSNIPFNITSAIVKKLTLENHPPSTAYLIIQREAAAKFAGKPLSSKNSQLSAILHPWFEFKVLRDFKSSDFFPRPGVDVVFLEIKNRTRPLIDPPNKTLFQDFITYTFNQTKSNIIEGLSSVFGKQNLISQAKNLGISPNSKPSELSFESWIGLFNLFQALGDHYKDLVKDSFKKQIKQQENLEKINRTRIDKSWKKFK